MGSARCVWELLAGPPGDQGEGGRSWPEAQRSPTESCAGAYLQWVFRVVDEVRVQMSEARVGEENGDRSGPQRLLLR